MGLGAPSFASLWLKAVEQALQLLLSQVYFVTQVLLLDDKHEIYLDKVLLVHQALGSQVAGQDMEDNALLAVQVVLPWHPPAAGSRCFFSCFSSWDCWTDGICESLLDHDASRAASRTGVARQMEDVQV